MLPLKNFRLLTLVVLALGASCVLFYEHWKPYLTHRAPGIDKENVSRHANVPTIDFPWDKVRGSRNWYFIKCTLTLVSQLKPDVKLKWVPCYGLYMQCTRLKVSRRLLVLGVGLDNQKLIRSLSTIAILTASPLLLPSFAFRPLCNEPRRIAVRCSSILVAQEAAVCYSSSTMVLVFPWLSGQGLIWSASILVVCDRITG